MISGDHVFKIGNFGVSIDCNIDPNQTPSSARKPQVSCSGDPIYIAPEVLKFDRSLANGIDAKTDIFSLGIILLELLCDIKAPSQGKVFHDLRQNKIDFDQAALSPPNSKEMNFGFNFEKKQRFVEFHPEIVQE